MARISIHRPIQSSHHHTWKRYPECTALGLGLLLALSSCAGAIGGAKSPAPSADRNSPERSADLTVPTQSQTTDETTESLATAFQAMPDVGESLKQATRRLQLSPRRLLTPADPVEVVIYRPDAQCQTYTPELVQVPQQDALTETVEYILLNQTIPYFELSGYRLHRQPNSKAVTIDLRVSRTSQRLLNSLSFCEQKALFGSLKETLINHPDWEIEDVNFTNRGNPLTL